MRAEGKQTSRRRFLKTMGTAVVTFPAVSAHAGMHHFAETSNTVYHDAVHPANEPFGIGKGIFPGRVVWVHNPEATNENCVSNAFGHAWFAEENNNQNVIDQMLSDALQNISGQADDSSAWEAIFKYHNRARGKGKVAYSSGEKIFIKINATSSWSGNINPDDLSIVKNKWYGISETSPHLILALLRQLVNVVGVAQQDIYIGDPIHHIYKHCYDLWHPEFPDIHYLDHNGWADREKVIPSETAIVKYSDRGTVLREGTWSDATAGAPVTEDHLYTIFEEAEYLLNVPTLKAHKHAGITLFAKNHFGSQTRNDAKHLHNGLVAPEKDNPRRQGYGLYRVQVDLLGYGLLGGKTLIYLLDALWTSDYEIKKPVKWMMEPFNNDWTSSLFVSFDPVAIESVAFDFLRSEFTVARGLNTYPQMEGVDDYLHQAADSANWPQGIVYDPKDEGTPLESLGAHEHWNNAVDKKYSRNLGTGEGIELLHVSQNTRVDEKESTPVNDFSLAQNYPNPFNASTTIQYSLSATSHIEISIFNVRGQKVKSLVDSEKSPGTFRAVWDGRLWNGVVAPSGVYIYKMTVTSPGGRTFQKVKEMILMK